jgi:hypothetical protein
VLHLFLAHSAFACLRVGNDPSAGHRRTVGRFGFVFPNPSWGSIPHNHLSAKHLLLMADSADWLCFAQRPLWSKLGETRSPLAHQIGFV